MKRIPLTLTVLLMADFAACFAPALSADVVTGDPLGRAATWQPPRVEEVKTQAMAWLEKATDDTSVRAKAKALWEKLPQQPSGSELLGCVAGTLALGDPRAAKLVEMCAKPPAAPALPSQAWLAESKTPPIEANNLRLVYGRWLTQSAMFDEALEQIKDVKPADVAAPAELLFYQGVAYHRLLQKEPGLKAIDQLLDGAESSPRRFVAVARLMQSDLSGLKPDTLDHIARQMQDIERRLDLGRAGPKVRQVEDDVVKALDKLIKKIEDQQQQDQEQQQQSQNGPGNKRSTSPAPDSRILGGRGPGDVTPKNVGAKSGWGDLPPKEREEALQEISRDFPSHYRDVIEQYFRRIASDEAPEDKR
jgi:hypothetical protein